MNNLIIIGNGFDLAHGLETSYKHFVLWYLNEIRKVISADRRYVDKLVKIETSDILIQDKPFESIPEVFEFFDKNRYRIDYKYDLIKEMIGNMTSGNWVDIEYFYYSHLVNLYLSYEKNFSRYGSMAKDSAKNLNTCFSEIIRLLEEYLATIIIYEKTRNESISKRLKGIIQPDKYNERHTNPPITLVLNFNYTKTLEFYLPEMGQAKKRLKIVNIHGSINSEENPVIFGYGDEMDPYYPKLENLNMNHFLDYIKSFHYFKTGNYRELISFMADKLFNVYIMGHSCGISDRILLNSIFEHPKCTNIKIYYHKRKDGTTDYFEKTQEMSRHFKPEYKSVMRKRIIPFDQCKPLV